MREREKQQHTHTQQPYWLAINHYEIMGFSCRFSDPVSLDNLIQKINQRQRDREREKEKFFSHSKSKRHIFQEFE